MTAGSSSNPLKTLAMVFAAALTQSVAAATITGQVTVGGAPLAGAAVVGPKAVCTASDAAGNYSCALPPNWTGTLAAYQDGYAFSPATHEYAALNANQTAQNFAGARVAGLRPDVVLWRPASAQFLIDVNGDSVPDLKVPFGNSTDVPLLGDLDGNGVSDLVLYRNGYWFVDTNLDGVADMTLGFGGAPGDVPLLCDFSGDGVADLVIYRGGAWFASTQRNGIVDKIFYFGGAPGDVPLCGDFDGDGVADLVIYRNGVWFIDTNRDGVPDLIAYFGGVAGDVPLVLDYNGDGRSDLAIYRKGIWYVNTQLDGTVQAAFGYGAASDRPLAGYVNRANTLFVRAGSACTTGCTMSNPYGTIVAAWQDAPPGAIIRVAGGAYPQNLVFSYPGNQYAPGKFGKNDIKLLGVSRNSVIVAPPANDALVLQGATGYVIRGMRITGALGLGRGIVAIGGPGSVLPGFPGAQFALGQVDAVDGDGTNVLLTGTSSARIRDSRLSHSRSAHGVSLWQSTYARVLDSEVRQNGYGVPASPLPDAGKGFDVRDDSEIDVRRTLIRDNLTFGVIAINRSVVRLTSSTVATSGYDGIMVCGSAPNDATAAYLVGNWIAGNGTVPPTPPNLGWNGVEFFVTCTGSQQVTANAFIGNTLNGLFIGSGSGTVTGNTFQANKIGITAFAGSDGVNSSATDTTVGVYGNTFDGNTVDGFYAARSIGTPRTLFATVGGTTAGKANTFRNQVAPAFHAISCDNVTNAVVCPSGGNAFSNNVDDIEATCPATCTK